MIRKLAFALSLLGACVTGLVHALGLGDATVKSSLNQPLTAEIELVSVGDLDVNEILPGLASREEFLKAGVDRVYFLSDIRFNVAKNDKGRLVVVLTTSKPVREPFINFLVEVIWPSGRLLREYALLIDPPLFNQNVAAPVQAPVTYQTISGDHLNIAQPTTSAAPRSSVSTSSARSVDGSYGPTNERDTLWEIALKARSDRSVSPQQVMLAIQDLNPTAFIDNNINKLKAGYVLRLPTLDQIRQRDGDQAIRQVIAQNEALTSKRGKSVVSATGAQPKPRASDAVAAGDELKLVVADSQSTATNSANSGQSTVAGKSDGGAEKLTLAMEKLDKVTIENNELSSRVNDLEGQLQTLQRLLTLKNDQLASVQEQMRANELAKLESEQANAALADTPRVESELSSVSPVTEATGETDQPSVSVAPEEQTKEVGQVEADTAPTEVITNTASDAESDKSVAPSEVVEVAKPEPIERKAKPQASAKVTDKAVEEDFLESIVANPFYLSIAIVSVLVLAALLWLVARNNSKKEEEFQSRAHRHDDEATGYDKSDSEIDFGSADEQYGAANLDDEDDEEEHRQELDHETEDVIAEADVYIAYGRLDQAASILEEAISIEPVRIDYRLKLLEVYKESNDVDAFNRQFSELEAIQDPGAIKEAIQLRRELFDKSSAAIDSDNEWLGEGTQVNSRQTKSSSKFEQQRELEAQSNDNEAASEFDFDLEETDKSGDELDIDYSSEELDLDLDLDLNLDDETESKRTRVSEHELVDETDALALDDTDRLAGEPDDDSINEALDAVLSDDLDEVSDQDLTHELDESLDVEFNDIEFSEELEQESEIELPEDLSFQEDSAERTVLEPPRSEQIVSDDILDEAVEALADDEDFEANLGEGEEFDFLDGTDEASTKLDLARAYIDMGDIDGARDILEEVSKEGSDEQRAEALSLLDSLSSQ